ncbi:MAG: hypothetical protein PHU51_03275 [Candidatus Nanoarchaeia archaeon]|nr:hypothetical protein [Candidatus Nanoarchaeia archaeon]
MGDIYPIDVFAVFTFIPILAVFVITSLIYYINKLTNSEKEAKFVQISKYLCYFSMILTHILALSLFIYNLFEKLQRASFGELSLLSGLTSLIVTSFIFILLYKTKYFKYLQYYVDFIWIAFLMFLILNSVRIGSGYFSINFGLIGIILVGLGIIYFKKFHKKTKPE